jgi:hypothetical protein
VKEEERKRFARQRSIYRRFSATVPENLLQGRVIYSYKLLGEIGTVYFRKAVRSSNTEIVGEVVSRTNTETQN